MCICCGNARPHRNRSDERKIDPAQENENFKPEDIKINTSVHNKNVEKKPVPDTGGTTNIRQMGDIIGTFTGGINFGDKIYNISLKSSDFEDEAMKDFAAGKLAHNTKAASDYEKLPDSEKENIRNKMRAFMDKEKAK
jgi:hypothetical protein